MAELYALTVRVVNGDVSYGKRCRRRPQSRLIRVNVDNLRNRPLSAGDSGVVAACIPDLYRRINPQLSSLSVVDMQLLRRPKRPEHFRGISAVPVPRCRCYGGELPCRNVPAVLAFPRWLGPVKPPGLAATADTPLFQVFQGSLQTAPHPEDLTASCLNRWKTRNTTYDHRVNI